MEFPGERSQGVPSGLAELLDVLLLLNMLLGVSDKENNWHTHLNHGKENVTGTDLAKLRLYPFLITIVFWQYFHFVFFLFVATVAMQPCYRFC